MSLCTLHRRLSVDKSVFEVGYRKAVRSIEVELVSRYVPVIALRCRMACQASQRWVFAHQPQRSATASSKQQPDKLELAAGTGLRGTYVQSST